MEGVLERAWNHPPLDKCLELVEHSTERSTRGVTERWARGFLVLRLTECTKSAFRTSTGLLGITYLIPSEAQGQEIGLHHAPGLITLERHPYIHTYHSMSVCKLQASQCFRAASMPQSHPAF